MLCTSETALKQGHHARLHIMDGLYSNFATDEVVNTNQQKKGTYWINLLKKYNSLDPTLTFETMSVK